MTRQAAAALPGLFLALASCRALPQVPPADAEAPALDFRRIYHLTEVYAAVRYDDAAKIRADWAPYYDRLEVVDLQRTRNRYLVGTLEAARRQEIVIRGTTNLKNIFYDARVGLRWNRELGLRLHAGFEAMALVLHEDILPRLDRGCELTVMGHSLGAAEAVILGMLLARDGFRVQRVYASGQPRVTDAAGALKYAGFGVLRIVNDNDPVPLLPPHGYRHLGPAVLLLDEAYFCYLNGDFQHERLAADLWQNRNRGERVPEQFREHSVLDYLARLNPKLTSAVQVPFAQRWRFLPDPRSAGEH
jgi:hypothetical protein